MNFYESANGVILTAGFDGCVPPAFFSRVTDRTGADVHFDRGVGQPKTGDAGAEMEAPPGAAAGAPASHASAASPSTS